MDFRFTVNHVNSNYLIFISIIFMKYHSNIAINYYNYYFIKLAIKSMDLCFKNCLTYFHLVFTTVYSESNLRTIINVNVNHLYLQ